MDKKIDLFLSFFIFFNVFNKILKRVLTFYYVINIMLITKEEVIGMEMKFTKDDSVKFIEEYYQKFESRNINAKIKSEKTTCGYGMGEMDTCSTSIVIEEEIEIMGIKTKTTERLGEDKLLGIFKAVLEDYGYDVKSAKFDDGINHTWEGCYMNEHQVARVYCKGVELSVQKLVKQKSIGGK